MLHRALDDFRFLFLFQCDKSALKHFRPVQCAQFWICLPGEHDLCQMIKIGMRGCRINKDCSAQRLWREIRADKCTKSIKDRLSWMQENSSLAITWRIERIEIADLRWIRLQKREEAIHRPWLERAQAKDAIDVSLDPNVDERSRVLDKVTHVAGEQLAVCFLLQALAKTR